MDVQEFGMQRYTVGAPSDPHHLHVLVAPLCRGIALRKFGEASDVVSRDRTHSGRDLQRATPPALDLNFDGETASHKVLILGGQDGIARLKSRATASNDIGIAL
jgi:hypothetical protein